MEENRYGELDLTYTSKRDVARSGLLGFFIGLAVIVPGISGSTIAILFKLYDKLLYAISNIFNKFKLCVLFLLPIVIGVGIGFILGFITVKQLLDLLPFAITSLFAGLMVGAFPAVNDEIKSEKLTPTRIVLFIIGFLIPIAIGIVSTFISTGSNTLENLQFYNYLLFLVLGYAVAITQVVPGLSATAILMAFGYFKPIMDSVSVTYWQNNPQVFLVYICLGVGFLLGLITFSKVLTFSFKKARKTTFFAIVGLSLGSIVSMFFNPDIYQIYVSWANGNTSMILDLCLGIALLVVGAICSYMFVRYERRKSINNN